MEQPQLSSYGLTESDFQRWRRIHEELVPNILTGLTACLVGLGILGGTYVAVRAEGISLATPIVVMMFATTGATMAFTTVALLGLVILALGFVLSMALPSMARYRAFTRAQKDYQAWKVRTLANFWRSLSGRAFEVELAALFVRKGYTVELTPTSGDKGIDIILKGDGRKTIVQCKATRKPVGPGVARELYGTLVATGADDAILAAIGGVSLGTTEFVRGKPIRVLTLSDIIAWHSGEMDKLPAFRHREAG